MRILIPTADFPPIEGGISTVALNLARELSALGHQVSVIAPYFSGTESFDEAEPATIIRYRGYGLRWARFLSMLTATLRRARAADLILGINVAYGGVFGMLAKRLYAKPNVTFAYAYEFLKYRKWPLIARLLRRVYAQARVVVAISRFTRDNLVEFGVNASRISVIWPGAPLPGELPAEVIEGIKHRFVLDTDHIILAVGRFVPRKGHITLVRAMPRILERYPDAVLVLVGRGPCLSPVLKAAHALNVRENVVVPGCLSDEEVAGLYRLCEVFALPTGSNGEDQVEGFGLVFAEAHAYGKPVVAGRSGGVIDAVIDGDTGLIVEPDDPDALANAILSLMHNPDLAHCLGDNGRRRVERELNWRVFTRRVMEEVERRVSE